MEPEDSPVIPPLEDGVLPDGVFDCTFNEIDQAFGRFQRSDRRIRLVSRLKAYLDEARTSGLVAAVLADGSFTTAKDEPSDIDLVVVLKPDIPWDSLRPVEYNVVSKRMVKQTYRFDAYACVDGDQRYREALDYFMQVNPDKHSGFTSRTRKGLVRVQL
jgi:Family of unknown function (DUF6932)